MITLLFVLASSSALAQGEATRARVPERIAALITTVEREHIRPPARRVLLESALGSLEQRLELELDDWRARIPAELDEASTLAWLRALGGALEGRGGAPVVGSALAAGVSRRIPGGALQVDADAARVEDSLEANQYVGVGVVLDLKGPRPIILDTYFGGPAHRGGVRPGDVVYEVDGLDTLEMAAARFIDYSRGRVGDRLAYVVGQPGEERRSLELERRVVPRETVVGTERGADERWRFRMGESTVAYVKLSGLTASTAHELRKAITLLSDEGCDRVVLDLRELYSANVLAASQVADLFCAAGLMGKSATRSRTMEYRASREAALDPRRSVVLVDGRTRCAPEWLAAVLRRAGATLVGEDTPGVPFLPARVEVPGWERQVRLATGWLLDPEGDEERPLAGLEPDRRAAGSGALELGREISSQRG